MYPPSFGSYVWAILHMTSLNYPAAPTHGERQKTATLINSLLQNLPCPGCAFHAVQYAKEHPLALDSRDDLVLYMIQFHNSVNERTGKRVLPIAEAMAKVRGLADQKEWRVLQTSQTAMVEYQQRSVAANRDKDRWRVATAVLGTVLVSLLLVALAVKAKGKSKMY